MARKLVVLALVLAVLAAMVSADSYMHCPRGSNGRLNGDGQDRNGDEADRLFDSQNNDQGGYCWGPTMYYYTGSLLTIEWTNQHGCGDNPNTKCEVVLQYMCEDYVRDGVTQTQVPDDATEWDEKADVPQNPNNAALSDFPGMEKKYGDDDGQVYRYGVHEHYNYYQDCKTRQRNQGLFIADRNLGGNAAIFTRQNNNGNRRGFECVEERDYYPYWHPTPWKDIAILTTDTGRCGYYGGESQNVKSKGYCSLNAYNNKGSCRANGGKWKNKDSWGRGKPHCREAPWSRDNHLGNGKTNQANTFNWTIPSQSHDSCVLRLRYNISSADYNGWGTFSKSNGKKSPVKNNPFVMFANRKVRLALNTSQFGRTFQDRSHVFEIRKRPSAVAPTVRVWNLNIRGKRGNIVQVYPAVEYDFTPPVLDARAGDYIHIQWTGCDHNPANNAGEGTARTDRSNIVMMGGRGDNYPKEQSKMKRMFKDSVVQTRLTYLDQKNCVDDEGLDNADVTNCFKLNAAPAYFDAGLIKFEDRANFYYMSTRNNNYTNRSQKGELNIRLLIPIWAIVLVVFASTIFLGSTVVGALFVWGKFSPNGRISRFFDRVPL